MSSGSLTARSSKSDVASEKSSKSTKNMKTKEEIKKKKKPIFYINCYHVNMTSLEKMHKGKKLGRVR